jgi:hypothetical protein
MALSFKGWSDEKVSDFLSQRKELNKQAREKLEGRQDAFFQQSQENRFLKGVLEDQTAAVRQELNTIDQRRTYWDAMVDSSSQMSDAQIRRLVNGKFTSVARAGRDLIAQSLRSQRDNKRLNAQQTTRLNRFLEQTDANTLIDMKQAIDELVKSTPKMAEFQIVLSAIQSIDDAGERTATIQTLVDRFFDDPNFKAEMTDLLEKVGESRAKGRALSKGDSDQLRKIVDAMDGTTLTDITDALQGQLAAQAPKKELVDDIRKKWVGEERKITARNALAKVDKNTLRDIDTKGLKTTAITKAVVNSPTASFESKLSVYNALPIALTPGNQETLKTTADNKLKVFGQVIEFRPDEKRMVFTAKSGKPSMPITQDQFQMLLQPNPTLVEQQIALKPADYEWFERAVQVAEHKGSKSNKYLKFVGNPKGEQQTSPQQQRTPGTAPGTPLSNKAKRQARRRTTQSPTTGTPPPSPGDPSGTGIVDDFKTAVIETRKWNPYKLDMNSGLYGEAKVNVEKLLNKMKLDARNPKTGKGLKRDIDVDFLDLLTRRFNPKKAYSPSAISAFQDLTKIAQIPANRRSKKASLAHKGGAVSANFHESPDNMIKRLSVITGSIGAGNTPNKELAKEGVKILDNLLNKKAISDLQHRAIFEGYFQK